MQNNHSKIYVDLKVGQNYLHSNFIRLKSVFFFRQKTKLDNFVDTINIFLTNKYRR